MNEIGLDPGKNLNGSFLSNSFGTIIQNNIIISKIIGIDHLYAVKTIDEVHSAGGKVL